MKVSRAAIDGIAVQAAPIHCVAPADHRRRLMSIKVRVGAMPSIKSIEIFAGHPARRQRRCAE
jgi:predicted solute-binding protein